ncbi:type I-E CRISPR-associated protein Cas6/Cse3/CasE [Nocardia higoensis]|uniref:type I-E CRISPR-associated protein Cas6/Cse3/CasE n=1 Tax=Nocardia higoensis TaxID=228599 RepID=UPI002B4AAEF2|nr:type I-E CRISPR-associated protein Cas6/Cse3/CasE [Nocardia higoensis]
MTEPAAPAPASARFVTTHHVLALDARHPFTTKALLDAQAMHRTVMSGFHGWVEQGEPNARQLMGILSTWNLDLQTATLVLVVQAAVPADWSRIPSAAMKFAPKSLPVDAVIRKGATYGFRTVVNPTRDRAAPKPAGGSAKQRGRRSPHSSPKWVESWFTERLQPEGEPNISPNGVRRIGAHATSEQFAVRMLPMVSSNGPHAGLRITRAEIKGTLTATDPATFVNALTTGIGHGRAYSTGLILIRA